MFLYEHRDGRKGTGPGTWFAIKDALGAEEAGVLVEKSERASWNYKVIQVEGIEGMTSVRQMPLIVDGEEIGMFHEVNEGPQSRKAQLQEKPSIVTQADMNLMNELVAKMEAAAEAAGRSWTSVDDLPPDERISYRALKAKFDKALNEDFQPGGQHGIGDEEYGRQARSSWRITMAKKDENVEDRLSQDRDEKGQEPLARPLEEGVKTDRKDNDEQVRQPIEKNLRDQKRAGAPNAGATGLVEKRLNDASQALYPHRNEEAWARTGQKRPVNALPEELGKASDDKKRERWSKANKAGEKRVVDKDIGKQLELPKTRIEQKQAFNLRSKRIAKLEPYAGYLTYRSSKAGTWSDKFASVREIDARMSEILSSQSSLSASQRSEIDSLKEKKAALLGVGKKAQVVKQMDHAGYQKKLRSMDEDALRYIIKDAKEAIEANPEGPNAGYYQDEISYAAMELKRRGQA